MRVKEMNQSKSGEGRVQAATRHRPPSSRREDGRESSTGKNLRIGGVFSIAPSSRSDCGWCGSLGLSPNVPVHAQQNQRGGENLCQEGEQATESQNAAQAAQAQDLDGVQIELRRRSSSNSARIAIALKGKPSERAAPASVTSSVTR